MARPAVLVIALPWVCASALAFSLEQEDAYDLYVPDVAAGEGLPRRPFDAVLTTIPAADAIADVVIELPESFDHPVTVRMDDVTFHVTVSTSRPLDDVAALLHRYLVQGAPPPAGDSVIAAGAQSNAPSSGPLR